MKVFIYKGLPLPGCLKKAVRVPELGIQYQEATQED